MRLLDKKTISSDLARQKKLQIDEGVTLATKVDTLRETALTEEGNLQKFRSETIKQVQKEIDAKVQERDLIDSELMFKREERIRLSAPIDLSEAWEEVKAGKAEIADWRERLTEKEVYAIAREATIADSNEKLSTRAQKIASKETLAHRTLTDAQTKHEQASQVLDKATTDATALNATSMQREKVVSLREKESALRESELKEREQKATEHELDLSNRELALKDRYETFIKAQNYINNQK